MNFYCIKSIFYNKEGHLYFMRSNLQIKKRINEFNKKFKTTGD